jgi:hypothetical protein
MHISRESYNNMLAELQQEALDHTRTLSDQAYELCKAVRTKDLSLPWPKIFKFLTKKEMIRYKTANCLSSAYYRRSHTEEQEDDTTK